MSQCPDIVEEYLQYGKDTEYDVVHLLVDLDLSRVRTDIDHGQITAVIRHKTPYTINGKGLFVHSFTLCNDVSLRCVLIIPTLLESCASMV